jgi:diaminopimelate decarboxylase
VNGAVHHQMAASGRIGQVIRGNYPMSVANRMDADDSEVVQMVGCLCPPLDLLGDKVALPRRRGWRPDRALPGTAA